MVINPNLYKGPSRVFVPKHSSTIYLDKLNLVDGETYIVSVINKQGNGGTGLSDLNIHDNITYIMGTRIKKDIRQSYRFKYRANQGYIIKLFNDIWGEHEKVSATFVGIKIEVENKYSKNAPTLYTPNENSLETAKRQYFIGGGTSRKSILFSGCYKQSSFRKEVAA